MELRILKGFILIGILLGGFCNLWGLDVPVRQRISDAGCFITYDFSDFALIKKTIGTKRPFYEAELLKLLNTRVGVYESEDVSNVNCPEWPGATSLIMQIDAHARVKIFQKNGDGKLLPLRNADGGGLSDLTIFLGPKENALLFWYAMASNSLYTLFSPNGLQFNIRFTRIRDLPHATKLPSPHEYQKYLNGCTPMKPERERPTGIFEAVKVGDDYVERGFERHYLVCGNGHAYSVFYKDSFFWYDVNMDFTDLTDVRGPFGRYAYDGTRLRFSTVPVGEDEAGMMVLGVARATGASSNRIARLENQLTRNGGVKAWPPPGPRITLPKVIDFRRCGPLPMTLGNTRICCLDRDVTTPEKVKHYLMFLGIGR